MEFDTKVKLTERGSISAKSEKDLDSFCEAIWPVVGMAAKNKADDGRGRIWLDYSNNLRTQYIVVDVYDQAPPEGETLHEYTIRIHSAKKPGYFTDVVLALLAVLAMYCISKISVPDHASVWFGGLITAAAIAGVLAAYLAKPFGVIESAAEQASLKEFLKV